MTGPPSSTGKPPPALMHMWEVQNQTAARNLGIAISIIISHVALYFWLHKILRRSRPSSNKFPLIKRWSRIFRSSMIRRMRPLPSVGHAVLLVHYIAINAILLCTNIDYTLVQFGKRFGWLCVVNLAITSFLALKNTPMGFVLGLSYEKLNILHQLAGYTTILFAAMHGILLSVFFYELGNLDTLLTNSSKMGIVAMSALLLLLLTSVSLRFIKYEVFYALHVSFYILIIVTVALHEPETGKGVVKILIFTGALWVIDRSIRGSRMLYNGFGNSVVVTPLGGNGARLVLTKPLWRAKAGKHVFLWIPGVSLLQTHPFTVVNINPLELVVKAHDGFTKRLLAKAQQLPAMKLRASVDGPYGVPPLFENYNNIIFIAGGSGASFTFGAALETTRKQRERVDSGGTEAAVITFIWCVRAYEMVTWFTHELAELKTYSNVVTIIHVSSSSSPITPTRSEESSIKGSSIPSATRRSVAEETISTEAVIQESKGSDEQGEKCGMSVSELATGTIDNLLPGRPNLEALIGGTVGSAEATDRVLVAACGPDGMMADVRKIVVALIPRKGPSVELYSEKFGW